MLCCVWIEVLWIELKCPCRPSVHLAVENVQPIVSHLGHCPPVHSVVQMPLGVKIFGEDLLTLFPLNSLVSQIGVCLGGRLQIPVILYGLLHNTGIYSVVPGLTVIVEDEASVDDPFRSARFMSMGRLRAENLPLSRPNEHCPKYWSSTLDKQSPKYCSNWIFFYEVGEKGGRQGLLRERQVWAPLHPLSAFPVKVSCQSSSRCSPWNWQRHMHHGHFQAIVWPHPWICEANQ